MKNKNGVVYKIVNIINNQIYIGSTIDYYNRTKGHIRQLRKNKHHSIIFQNSWNKYGEENFKVEIIEESEIDRLIEREQFWINKLRPKFNCSPTAGSPLGVKRSKETKQKLRIITLKQFKEKGHPCKGKKFSKQARKNLSEAQKGRSLEERGHKTNCKCCVCRTKRGEFKPRYIEREKRECICGCGQNFECLINSKRRFINGHNKSRLGKLKTKQEIEKQRKSIILYHKTHSHPNAIKIF